jgi:hypothetical protein
VHTLYNLTDLSACIVSKYKFSEMDLVSDTPEFLQTGKNMLQLVLEVSNFGLVKTLVVVQHLCLGVRHWTFVENQVPAVCNCSMLLGICRVEVRHWHTKNSTCFWPGRVRFFTAKLLLYYMNWVLYLWIKYLWVWAKCTGFYVRILVCIIKYIHLCIYDYIYIYTYVHIYIHWHVCIYIYIYTHTHIHSTDPCVCVCVVESVGCEKNKKYRKYSNLQCKIIQSFYENNIIKHLYP